MLSGKFASGASYRKGETIISIDPAEFNYSLKTKKSTLLTQLSSIMGDIKLDYPEEFNTWNSFIDQIDFDKPLPDLPEVQNLTFKKFLASNSIFTTYFDIKSSEKILSKYTISAPFSGTLSEASIKKGTLVRSGQRLGKFNNTDIYELNVLISQSDLSYAQKDIEISFYSDNSPTPWMGKLDRINSVLDESSQMASVYFNVEGKNLREGEFLYGTIVGKEFNSTAKIDRKLIKRGGVYTVKNGKIGFKKVDILFERNDYVILSGLAPTDELVADNMKDIFDGMDVLKGAYVSNPLDIN